LLPPNNLQSSLIKYLNIPLPTWHKYIFPYLERRFDGIALFVVETLWGLLTEDIRKDTGVDMSSSKLPIELKSDPRFKEFVQTVRNMSEHYGDDWIKFAVETALHERPDPVIDPRKSIRLVNDPLD
jgi:hypothetical protein